MQAGGNVGVYPVHLAAAFREVFTFEPDPDNFECLQANTAEHKNIRCFQEALGEKSDRVGMIRHHDNSGAHRVSGSGPFALVRLDDIGLPYCDLIWLDVEGYEPKVLEGARNLIERHRPIVIVEDMGLAVGGEGVARDWLKGRGYRQTAQLLNDFVMVPDATA